MDCDSLRVAQSILAVGYRGPERPLPFCCQSGENAWNRLGVRRTIGINRYFHTPRELATIRRQPTKWGFDHDGFLWGFCLSSERINDLHLECFTTVNLIVFMLLGLLRGAIFAKCSRHLCRLRVMLHKQHNRRSYTRWHYCSMKFHARFVVYLHRYVRVGLRAFTSFQRSPEIRTHRRVFSSVLWSQWRPVVRPVVRSFCTAWCPVRSLVLCTTWTQRQ